MLIVVSARRTAGGRVRADYWAAGILSRDGRRVTHLVVIVNDDDDKFTPTKHLTPPPHNSSRPAAAHTDTETPLLHQIIV